MADTKIEGLDNVLDRFEVLGDTSEVKSALERACMLVESAAKKNAPKDTGALRNSIQSRIEANGDEVQGIVFTPLEYAPYVEYGTGLFAEKGGRKDVPWGYEDDKGEFHLTSGQHPHPFMRPAFNSNREKIIKILGESIKHD